MDETWVDQRWAEIAERGRVGGARRQLMLKTLVERPLQQEPQERPLPQQEQQQQQSSGS